MVVAQHLQDYGEGLDDGSRRGGVCEVGEECGEGLADGFGVGEDEFVVVLRQRFFAVQLQLGKASGEGFLGREGEGEGEEGFEHLIE